MKTKLSFAEEKKPSLGEETTVPWDDSTMARIPAPRCVLPLRLHHPSLAQTAVSELAQASSTKLGCFWSLESGMDKGSHAISLSREKSHLFEVKT